jgi:hypothetical protein
MLHLDLSSTLILRATNSKPRLEDLPDPPAAQRPLQTIRVLASAALRSEPKGNSTLEEMVDRICSRFEYFQDMQNRATEGETCFS